MAIVGDSGVVAEVTTVGRNSRPRKRKVNHGDETECDCGVCGVKCLYSERKKCWVCKCSYIRTACGYVGIHVTIERNQLY